MLQLTGARASRGAPSTLSTGEAEIVPARRAYAMRERAERVNLMVEAKVLMRLSLIYEDKSESSGQTVFRNNTDSEAD